VFRKREIRTNLGDALKISPRSMKGNKSRSLAGLETRWPEDRDAAKLFLPERAREDGNISLIKPAEKESTSSSRNQH